MLLEGESCARDVYWNEFYASGSRVLAADPSSFAMLVAEEIQPASLIYEFGCGNGRDSLFFARAGHAVIAIDGSSAAIAGIDATIARGRAADIRTVVAKVDEIGLAERLAGLARRPKEITPRPVIIYARFFLHALTEGEQEAFVAVAARLLDRGGSLAVEFRTCEDRLGQKITRPHFRRYIDPDDFIATASASGLRPIYYRQGRGLARQGVDDAHVARIIFAGEGGKA